MTILLPSSSDPGHPLVSSGDGNLWLPGDFPENQGRRTRTYCVQGAIVVSSGATGYLPPFHIGVNNEAILVCVVARVRDNGSSPTVTVNIQQNGTNITGLTGLVVGHTLSGPWYPTNPVLIADLDEFGVVPTAIANTPDGGAFSFIYDMIPAPL